METVVFFMRADPKPGDDVTFAQAKRAIVLSNPNDKNTVSTFLKV